MTAGRLGTSPYFSDNRVYQDLYCRHVLLVWHTLPMVKATSRAKKHIGLVQAIKKQLEAASPTSAKGLLATLSIDLGDLYFVADTHQQQMKELFRMKFPRDKRKLKKLLGQLEANLLFENNWHLKSLKRRLPQFWKGL